MHYFGYNGSFIPDSVGLVLIAWIENCELTHGYAILNEVVHVVAHSIGIYFDVVAFQFFWINFIPDVGVDYQIAEDDDAVGYV